MTSIGSPGIRWINAKARIVIPMNVGITMAMRRRTNRNMVRLFGEEKCDRRRGLVTLVAGPFRLVLVLVHKAYREQLTARRRRRNAGNPAARSSCRSPSCSSADTPSNARSARTAVGQQRFAALAYKPACAAPDPTYCGP